MKNSLRATALLATVVLFAAACGGGETTTPAAAESAAGTAPAATDTTMAVDMSHEHAHMPAVEAPGDMTVGLRVEQDAKAGWNLFFDTTGFTWAPEHASTAHVPGEGHAHLYVDGTKVARIYGDAFHLESLDPGSHMIMIELNTNEHSPYAVDGSPVTDVATVEVPGVAETAAPDEIVEVSVGTDGTVDGPERAEVAVGETVTIRVTGHNADRLHVHGYDVYATLTHDTPAEVTFAADTAGIFEVELEDSSTILFELVVS